MKFFFKTLVVKILTWEAKLAIRRHRPSIVAVTGSVGKTSTKDAVRAALCESVSVRASNKSFNSEIGIPLTILGRPNAWSSILRWTQTVIDGLVSAMLATAYPDWLVLEIGADRPGDIRRVASWLPIDIAIITRLPEVPVHVEYFGSPEAVIEEKASLISGLKPNGTLVLYADDERVAAFADRLPAGSSVNVIRFGFSPQANIKGERAEFMYDDGGRPLGMRAAVKYRGEEAAIELHGVLGAHALLPVLAAAAVCVAQDRPLAASVEATLRNYIPPRGRMRMVAGLHGSCIIDDSYNSSPAALEAALQTLAAVPAAGRKIAVLGDMMELGRYSVAEHRSAGTTAAKCLTSGGRRTSVLMTVGLRARDSALAALEAGQPESNILQFENAEEAGAELARQLKAGDIVLIKGSQSMRMERAVELAMAEPARAEELLVRQEAEWQKS